MFLTWITSFLGQVPAVFVRKHIQVPAETVQAVHLLVVVQQAIEHLGDVELHRQQSIEVNRLQVLDLS